MHFSLVPISLATKARLARKAHFALPLRLAPAPRVENFRTQSYFWPIHSLPPEKSDFWIIGPEKPCMIDDFSPG